MSLFYTHDLPPFSESFGKMTVDLFYLHSLFKINPIWLSHS